MWPGQTDHENGSAPRMGLETLAETWGWQRAGEPPKELGCFPEDTGKPAEVRVLPSHRPLFTEDGSWFSFWAYAPTSILLLSFFMLQDWDPFQILILTGQSLQELPHTQFGQSSQGSLLLNFWTWGKHHQINSAHYMWDHIKERKLEYQTNCLNYVVTLKLYSTPGKGKGLIHLWQNQDTAAA